MVEDKIALIKLALTDKVTNPHFEANRKYALKMLDELQNLVATKVYSEDDLRKALSESFKASQEGYDISSDEIIQSLKQPKTHTP